jgi:hypothetical protein
MADRELIAATLAAAFIRPLDMALAGGESTAGIYARVAVDAVDIYDAILTELAARQSSKPS